MASKSRVVVRDVVRDELRELARESIRWLIRATILGHTHKAMALVIGSTTGRLVGGKRNVCGVIFNGKLAITTRRGGGKSTGLMAE